MLTDTTIDGLEGDALSIEITKARGEEWEYPKSGHYDDANRKDTPCRWCGYVLYIHEIHGEPQPCYSCNEISEIACLDYAGDLNPLFAVADELQDRGWGAPVFQPKNSTRGADRRVSIGRWRGDVGFMDRPSGHGRDVTTALARVVLKALQIEAAEKPSQRDTAVALDAEGVAPTGESK